MNLKTIFKHGRVAGIAGNRHTGKTNNIIAMIIEFRKTNKTTTIYAYGLSPSVVSYLKPYGVEMIDSVKQLANKKDSIIILDEFQKLKIGDRRHKDILIELMAMIYHPENNNYVLFCSPTTREYNSIIGGYIEVWLLKSMYLSDTINGSQLKEALKDYKGNHYKLGYYDIPKNKMVLLNKDKEIILEFDYIKDVDTKSDVKNILADDNVTELSAKKSEKLSEELSEATEPRIVIKNQVDGVELLPVNVYTEPGKRKPFIKLVER